MYVVLCDCDYLVDVGLFVVVRTPLYYWQDLTPVSNGGLFFEFCDALEVLNLGVPDTIVVPDADGWGLGHALAAWANYSKEAVSNCEWV